MAVDIMAKMSMQECSLAIELENLKALYHGPGQKNTYTGPGPSSSTSGNHYHDMPQDSESQLAKLAQEGGVGLINYLLVKADANDQPLPNQSSPREWTFRDI